MATIIDTDILIDASRNVSDAIDCLDRLEKGSKLAISVVTQMELIVGCRNKVELQRLKQFFNRFRIYKITEEISDQAIDLLQIYRLSHGLLIADSLIAATALEYGEPFITKNQRDYQFIAGLNLLAYP